MLRGGEVAWDDAFEETVRWISPIGMIPRETTQDVNWFGYRVPAGSDIRLLLASANRDARIFDDPDSYDIRRSARGHLGFGNGTHLCAGRWAAKTAIEELALPMLYERFPTLRIDTRLPRYLVTRTSLAPGPGMYPVQESLIVTRSAAALQDHRHPLAAADAHRLEAEFAVAFLQRVDQGRGDARAGHAERVPHGDGSAVDVKPLLVDPEPTRGGNDLGGERLVHLHQVNVSDRQARPGERGTSPRPGRGP